MKYMGSKNRLMKYLAPLMAPHIARASAYVEPFVGGGNAMSAIAHPHRIGADINEYVVCLLDAVASGWRPPEVVTEEEYYSAKISQELTPRTAFIGFVCSYGGRWFGGYARGTKPDGTPRNYAAEGGRNLLRQAPTLRGVTFIHASYDQLEIPPRSVIYCDPPYAGTQEYRDGGFDYEKFWAWTRLKRREGHTVFVSETVAPPDALCLWQKTRTSKLKRDAGKPIAEKLFMVGPPPLGFDR